MLPRLRRHLRVLAAIVLVSVSSLGGLSTAAHGLTCRDAENGPLVVAHDASAHAFRGAALPESRHDVHCVLCHWTRAFGPSAQSVTVASDPGSRPVALRPGDAAVARVAASSQPPLRAPPSTSASTSPA